MTRRAPANALPAGFRNIAVDAEGGWAFAAPPPPRFVYPVRSAPSQGAVVSTVIRSPVTWPANRSTWFPLVSKTVIVNVPLYLVPPDDRVTLSTILDLPFRDRKST